MNLQSEQIDQLVTALSKAQGELSPALKDKTNPHFKNDYADLNSVWNACRDILSKNGLAVIQTMDSEGGFHYLITTLAHKSGQWVKSKLPILAENNKPQTLGSAITYMRRYALSAIVGISQADDDAEVAEGRSSNQKPAMPILKATISSSQLMELEELFSQCSVGVKEDMMKPLGITLDKLPADLFDRVKLAAIKKKGEVKV